MRLNAYGDSGASIARDIPIGDESAWTKHRLYYTPDEDAPDVIVDVAVRPWKAAHEAFEYSALPTNRFLTDQMIDKQDEYGGRFGIGDEVFITGLFTRMGGRKVNLPILRLGTIAMMPTETVRTRRHDKREVEMDAYLIEARSIGGLSGSPVFVRETLEVGNLGPFYLLGLMHGHWDSPPGSIRDAATDASLTGVVTMEEAEKGNMGIGIVVPAKKVLEVLNEKDLVAERAKEHRQLASANLPTLDSADAP